MTGQAQKFAAGQIVGSRERQEDAYSALDLGDGVQERMLFVVADGMGGHAAAAEVSQLAVRRYCEVFQDSEEPFAGRLSRALTSANDSIATESVRDPALDGAGCTLLAAAIEDGALSWISVGDCSLYLFRGGELRKLNADHSMRPVYSEMVAAGRLSAWSAARDPRRTALRSALTRHEIPLVSTSPEPLRLLPKDVVLLASDGLETLDGRAISRVLKRADGVAPEEAVKRLFAAIESAGARNQDNTTIIFCRAPDRSIRSSTAGTPPARRSGAIRFIVVIALAAAILYAAWYGFGHFGP